ncbi:mannose-6-phosphate isomerase, class I [Salirhabdus salicampi]|uniref:mannose-6-phosphate isomerase, class I n=1 Tax=Salirhabdus salicampi TaxID=476102 RepID=UPI0020C1C2A1|nr:mannose-6-phosphate isomerase, class I [Salirhabdus salicampi]MCP8617344.1 mannose-6-phosphate isomerase, class I [Salirhabdus salicampi]
MGLEPLFLQPVFQERIWGGTKLRDKFGYNIPSERTGECWAISAHPNGESKVMNGEFKGKTLSELWEHQRELFGNHSSDVFPLLTKMLDASQNLSVQVHPDDHYAYEHENGELGKTECWYIIDCNEGAEIIIGHHAQSREQFEQMINEGLWNKLLRRIKIKPGDFFYVPSGTIHALCEGTLVLETQQSSDTTYRVYDYDRKDYLGRKRELHIDKAIDVTSVPHKDSPNSIERTEFPNGTLTTFVKSNYFSVHKLEVNGDIAYEQTKPFLLVSVIRGKGCIRKEKRYNIVKGDHFLLPEGFGKFQIEGEVEIIISHI